MRWSTVALLAFGAALAACTPAQTERGDVSAGPAGSVPATVAPSLPVSEVPSQLLQQVVAAAADRAGIEPAAVEVLTAESVTWSDGSLGCPEPGMMYTQALVPGYRVIVAAGGEEMAFHAGESGDFRLCEDPQLPADR